MAKTRRLIGESLKLVDLVLELTDARIPQSSRNPELDKWIANKPRIIMLNKADMADTNITNMWLEHYKNNGIHAIACDCKSGKGLNKFIPLVNTVLADLIERRKNKGLVGKTLKIMVVGIPNVGKSSFINRVAGHKKTKVEDRPGVTRGRQWVSISDKMELLDMPGVLWPKFEDPIVAERLAFTGAVKDDVIDIELLAMHLLTSLKKNYTKALSERYKIEDYEELGAYELLEAVGRKRGMLVSGGEINTERAAIMVLDEYRSGILGKISFDLPDENTTELFGDEHI